MRVVGNISIAAVALLDQYTKYCETSQDSRNTGFLRVLQKTFVTGFLGVY